MRFLLRRLGFYLLAAWVSLTLNFVLPRLMPGDPASAMFARLQGQLEPEALAALRRAYGFTDAPLWSQYWSYVTHVVTGDLGVSVKFFPAPVASIIGEGLGWTLLLAGTSVLISFTLGTLLGIVSAHYRGSLLDSTLPPLLTFLGAFPYFWLAMALLYVFGFLLGWFPLHHAYSDALEPSLSLTFFRDVVRHMVLPATSIVLATAGGWLLSMRNTMMSVMGEDYVTLAQAKGLPRDRVMLAYAARNALLPSLTSFGMALGFVLSGSLLTEIVFAYPGQGYLLIQAVQAQDYPLLQGLFLTITFAVLAANWLVDVLYFWLDPRTRVADR